MKTILWFAMLSKRLYKKLSFLAILLLIPALVLGYLAAAQGDSGMMTVALAQEGEDALASALIDSFDSSSQLIRYVDCTPAQAESMVRHGKADMAWIFSDDLAQHIADFAQAPTDKNAMVTVLVRQDDVTLKLAREALSGTLYSQISRQVYLDFIRENVPDLAGVSDEALLEYYNTRDITEELFAFDQNDPAMANAQQVHYLTAPVRGLLAVVMVLCGMAAAMYYLEDRRRGTFGWVSTRRLPAVELGCQLVALVNVAAVVLAALALSGQTGVWYKEIIISLLYCLCCAGFCMMLRRLCGSVRVLGTLLPLLVVAMLLICPVFFDLGKLRSLQYLLPPTYYINALYSHKYSLYMVLYTGTCFGVYGLLGLKKSKNKSP